MSEIIQDTTTAPQVDAPVVEGSGGLPSEQPSESNFSGFDLTDDLKGKFKGGKLNGRFESVDDILLKLKESEDRNANFVRDNTDADAATQTAKDDATKAANVEVKQNSTIMEMMPEFQANGYQLTQEMQDKAVAEGIDIRDLKLGAIEFKERVQTAYGITGGVENYNAMIEWGVGSMTSEQKASFDKEVTGSMSEYAIKGLYGDYTKAQASGETPARIEGSIAIKGIKPYGDRRELFKDRDYLASRAGRNDAAAQAHHRKRLNATPDSVLGL